MSSPRRANGLVMVAVVMPAVLCTLAVWSRAQGVPDSQPAVPGDPRAAAAGGEGPASQPVEVDAADAPEAYRLLTTDRLTGDWGGVRTWLEERGLSFEMCLVSYYQQVARGGLSTDHAHSIVGVNHLELTADLGLMKVIPGGTVYVWATSAWGQSPSTRGWVGDLFWVNGDEIGNSPIDVHELWYEQAFFEEKLRLRFGKICLSSSFDYNEYAWDTTTQFINYGLNNAPNIPFPANAFGALGAQVFVQPWDWLYFGAGVADADAEFNETGFETAFHGPADFFSMYEFGLTPTFETGRGTLPGHYRFGLWHDPRPKAEFYNSLGGRLATGPRKRDDVGFYLNFDQLLWREKPTPAEQQPGGGGVEERPEGLGAFFRYSYAPGDANLIEHFWSIGAQYQGPIPRRDDDVLAVGVAQGMLSLDSRLAGYDPHQETVIEAYYSIQLLPWLTLTPDMQWILQPGGEHGRDAWVIGLRLMATF